MASIRSGEPDPNPAVGYNPEFVKHLASIGFMYNGDAVFNNRLEGRLVLFQHPLPATVRSIPPPTYQPDDTPGITTKI